MAASSQTELPSTNSQFNAGLAPPSQPVTVTTPPDPKMIDDVQAKRQQQKMELRALAKTYGHIPGVPIFSTWDKREECMNAAVHRSIISGICGNKVDGVFSIAISGSYEDDKDEGDTVLYTGTGGRKKFTDTIPPKRIRCGPQVCDQSWEDPLNRAIIKSHYMDNPVRVIRSWQCVSQYAPIKGYRYDGLYHIVDHWTGIGKSGFAICRCRLERLPGQPPLPTRPVTMSTTVRCRKRGSNLTSSDYAFGAAVESPRQRQRIDKAGHAIGDPTGTQEVEGAYGSGVPQQTMPLSDHQDLSCSIGIEEKHSVFEANMDSHQNEDDDRTMIPEDDDNTSMYAKDLAPTEYFSDTNEDIPEQEPEVPCGSGETGNSL